MKNTYEIASLFVIGFVVAGIVIRLDSATKFVQAFLTDINSIGQTLSGTYGSGVKK